MNVDRDSGPQAAHYALHAAERLHAPVQAAAADRPAPLADEDTPYPRVVRAGIMLVGGGALWAGVLWAGARLLR